LSRMASGSWLLTGFLERWCEKGGIDMSPHLEREELAKEMLIELVDEGEVPE